MSNFNINEKYFWGQYESTMDGVSRLRLNRDITCNLREHEIRFLWIYPGTTIPAIILCPEQMCDKYIEQAKSILPKDMDPAIAHRKYLCTCRRVEPDQQGRIYISSFGLEHAGIKKEASVVIIGMGYWYEVWDHKIWTEGIKVSDS